MFAQARSVVAVLFVTATMAGCSPVTVVSGTPRPVAVKKTPASTPTPTPASTLAPAPPGPYAVVVTNSQRQGSTYDVLLIDLQAQVVARVTARLPLLKANQTVTLPLTSASDNLVYYLDGDTDIRSLAPSGATALVKTVAAGSTSILGFAVSPDDQRIAVALINQASDGTKDTGLGYVEDLTDSGNHVVLFTNTSTDALRWPVGWHGSDIVDSVGSGCQGYYGSGPCSASYHVVSSATGARQATVCEQPVAQPANANLNTAPNGLPVPGGVVCVKQEYYNGTQPNEADLLAVDWSGRVTEFANADKTNGQLTLYGCYLAPGAAEMACSDQNSQAVTIVAPGSSPHSLGRRYQVLGWVDATHLLGDIDASTLAVVDASTGSAINLALANADKAQMNGIEPGGL